MLWRVLIFVQVFKLSKVAGLQSATLIKMNYFTGSFKISKWLHWYHRIPYPVIQNIPRLQLRVNISTLIILSIAPHLPNLYHSVTLCFFVDLSCVLRISVPHRFHPLTICTKNATGDVLDWVLNTPLKLLFQVACGNPITELLFVIFSKSTLLK